MSRRRGFVCATRLYQNLAVALTLSLMLLSAGAFGLGLAIQRGVVEPPILDLRYCGSASPRIARTILTVPRIRSARRNPSHHRKNTMWCGSYMYK